MVISCSLGYFSSCRITGAAFWLSLLLVSCLVTACGKSVAPQQSLEDLHVRSQERLYAEAKRAFLTEQYPQAIRKLRRFLATYPRSPLEWDVTWLLARAYDRSGEAKYARQLYQQVLSHEAARAFHQEAKEYLARLPALPKAIVRDPSNVFALQMTLEQWLEGDDWNTRLKNMENRGVTAQLINIECGVKKQEAAFLLAGVPIMQPIRKDPKLDFVTFVRESHKQGMAVFLGVNIRCLGSLRDDPPSGWMDRAYNRGTQTIRSTKHKALTRLRQHFHAGGDDAGPRSVPPEEGSSR